MILIGYKTIGESLVLFVKNEQEDILWCGVVDCYDYSKCNVTKTILEAKGYGIDKRKIDFLCISHPDLDHIKCMNQIMEQFCNDDTMLLMPNFRDSSIKQSNEIVKIKEVLKNIFERKYTRAFVPDNLFFNRQLSLPNLRWKFICGMKEYTMQIESLTPTDSIMLNSCNSDYQNFKNDFSICLKITFNNNYFLFMGDCTDTVLVQLNEEYIPSSLAYLKLPHHGCRNATMESYIVSEIIKGISVSSCAYRKGTTLQDTLDFYSKNSDYLSLTGNLDVSKNKYAYGLLSHTYDMKTGDLFVEKCYADKNAILNYGK